MFERLQGGMDDDAISLYYAARLEASKSSFPVLMRVNQAHVVMLAEEGLITGKTARILFETFAEMLAKGVESLDLDPKLEDLYTNVERAVIATVGEEVGGQMHLGRSRNDLEVTISRMQLRDHLNRVALAIHELADVLLQHASVHVETIMPGYTHWQPAQPTTFAHYLLAIVDVLMRDLERIDSAYGRVNRCPLGGGAFAGTGFGINRMRTAELLGFEGLVENTLDATATVDHLVEVGSVLANHALTLGRYASDVVRWSLPSLGFVELEDGWCDSSSIMPQKKNPVMAEAVRAQATEVAGMLTGLLGVCRITLEPCRDITVAEEEFWKLVDLVERMTRIATGFTRGMTVNVAQMSRQAGATFTTTTELADTLVRETGLSFRQAHRVVANAVRKAWQEKPLGTITAAQIMAVADQVLGQPMKISEKSVTEALEPRSFVQRRSHIGGPAPRESLRMIQSRGKQLEEKKKLLEARIERCAMSRLDRMLREAMAAVSE